MIAGRVIEITNSYVIVLAKEKGTVLGVRDGDEVKIDRLIEAFNREPSLGQTASPKADVAEQLRIARQVIVENREALIELAK